MATHSVVMSNTTIVGDATLVILNPQDVGASDVLLILRAWVSQIGTEVSDQLGIMIGLKGSAYGTYTATNPATHVINGAASNITGGTAGAEGTSGTDASAEGAGGFTPIISEGFNNLNGWLWVPTPEERLTARVGNAVALKLIGTPSVLTGWNAGITFEDMN